MAFLVFFVSLVAVFWTYSYEVALNIDGVQTTTYPYRGYTILLGLISTLLFGIFIYSGIRKRRGI